MKKTHSRYESLRFHAKGLAWLLCAGYMAVLGDYTVAAMAVSLTWNHAKGNLK